MRHVALFSLAAALLLPIASAPVHAQTATRTWVSGTGADANPCSRTAPCKTFAGAISKTTARGEINCLDPGGYDTLTIAKEITIDCTGVYAGILNASVTGVVVNIPGGAVTLRGISIDGAGTGIAGVRIVAASKVNLENMEIFSNNGRGVDDARTAAGGVLVIENSVLRNNAASGVTVTGGSGGGVILQNVISKQNDYGIALPSGSTAVISRSSFTNNVTTGIAGDAGSQIHVTDSVLAFNGAGFSTNGTTTVANTSVVYNSTGIIGTITSFGNNRIFGNSSAGTAPVPAGGASSDLGQK